MNVITPTITTDEPHEYRAQMEIVAVFADGVHLDFSDGVFAPTRLLPLSKAWRSEDLITHAHIMYQKPLAQMKHILKLDADLVILHAESDDLKKCLRELHGQGVRAGIALLPDTNVDVLDEYESLFDHVLVFGGKLGYQGGKADLSNLEKVKLIKAKYPEVEISWDGGVNQENAEEIASAGVSILNVGGFIKNSENPKKAYSTLTELVY